MKSFKCDTLQTLVLLATAAFAAGAGAQTVYRCGSSYSQIPCNGGTEVTVDDARTDAQRAAAQAGLARDKALGKEMETSRRKDEAQVLAHEKAALSAQAKQASREKAESKKLQEKQKAASKKSSAKDRTKDHEVFTATVAGSKADSKRAPKPRKPTLPGSP
jgi:preprotein translocase subunit SecF